MLTLIVPAAGSGSRLGGGQPKALVELGGRPLIDWVLAAAAGVADRVVVVIQPQEQHAFERWAAASPLPVGLEWAYQPDPAGSLAAVRIGVRRAREIAGAGSGIIIVWADQAGVGAGTVRAVAEAVDSGEKVLAVPLAETASPYVWVELDAEGRIARVLRTRDGDASPAVGLADLGVFGLSASLTQAFVDGNEGGPADAGRRESDFTYALPRLGRLADTTFLPRVTDERELVAVNTPEDLARARDLLVRQR